ncbi:MAG: cytidine/deoxycytidylate deaminase family protein [Candidatus Omnitrophota bacterium]
MKKHNTKQRISWDEYFFQIAQLAAKRSTCLKNKQGAVIVKDKRILTTGYNGAPVKSPHCLETGCLRDEEGLKNNTEKLEVCRGLDAIQNAIIQAVICGVSIKDSVLYTTCIPSIMSAKIIINAGIKEIFTAEKKLAKLANELLRQSKIKIRKIK